MVLLSQENKAPSLSPHIDGVPTHTRHTFDGSPIMRNSVVKFSISTTVVAPCAGTTATSPSPLTCLLHVVDVEDEVETILRLHAESNNCIQHHNRNTLHINH
ncbi:unnamed protein product [Taenia asiatica]|uniref:Uncharacterized protein n=1 Tax=Taenia asiatica TaxID=60517 RepID=A0A0R3VZI3_TAEAS|nr:unnamed protein product [Taenia asiatica]